MKTKLLLFAVLATFTMGLNAQDYSAYLTKALQKYDAGDCAGAKQLYDVYKELSGQSKPSVENLINECLGAASKKYTLGDYITIRGSKYRIAYLDSSREHGIAIKSGGNAGNLHNYDMYYGDAHLITLDELNKIIPNKNAVQITGDCWTSTVSKASPNQNDIEYYVKNVETGITRSVDCYKSDSRPNSNLIYAVTF